MTRVHHLLRVRTQLILMAAAILIPVVIFSALALHMLRSSVREEALRGLRETANATALVVDREMASSVASLELLAASPALEVGDLSAFYEQARLLNNDHVSWIMLIDVLGEQLLHTMIPLGEPVPQASLFDDMWRAVETKRPTASNLMRNPLDGSLMTVIYVPVKTRAGKTFVLAKGFNLDFFTRTMFERNTPGDWVIGLLDHDGRFIARNFNNDIRVGQQARHELREAIGATRNGIIRHPTIEGVDSYDAFTPSQVTGWSIAVAAPVDQVETAAARAAMVAALGFLVAIGVAVLAAAALGRQLVKSIADAAEAANDLGTGQPPRPHPPSKVFELRRLQVALTDASDMLRREQLSRQQAESKLEELLKNEYQARLRAEAENESKDQFLAMLGHELRNPLAAISGAIALDRQQSESAGGPIAEEARQIIQRQSQHLGHIVNDLLDISRLAGGKISLLTQPLDFGALAEGCFDALRAAGRTAGFALHVSSTPVWVDGDATRLEQSVSNLLVNALKFTPPGGHIDMQVGEQDGQAVLRVRDSGMGISAELLPRVFDVFTQGPASLDRSQGGLGIGLALVRQLVRLHGGTVEAESEGPGLGSTFTIRLPRIEPPADNNTDSASDRHTVIELPALALQRAAEPPAAPHLLLIEDIDDVRSMMSQLLEMEGYRVSDTAHAREGVRMALQLQPLVGIIDIGLPDMNGYDVARALRADPLTRHMGLMALTGYGQDEDRKKALDAGFDVHLVKPVDMDALFESIEACSDLARERQRNPPLSAQPARRDAVTN